jgi:hypothetical protein
MFKYGKKHNTQNKYAINTFSFDVCITPTVIYLIFKEIKIKQTKFAIKR